MWVFIFPVSDMKYPGVLQQIPTIYGPHLKAFATFASPEILQGSRSSQKFIFKASDSEQQRSRAVFVESGFHLHNPPGRIQRYFSPYKSDMNGTQNVLISLDCHLKITCR